MPSKSQPASHQTVKGGGQNTKPDRAPGGPLTGRVPPYVLANLLHADPEEALPSTDGTVSKPDWLNQIRGKLQLHDSPGQEPTSKDLATLDLLIDAVEKDAPILNTCSDLWRFCVKTLSLPENTAMTFPNPSRLASVMLTTAKITTATSAQR